MKLDAGNPNLMKKAMRVNRPTPMESFANTTGDKEQAQFRTGFVPSIKDPDVVPSPAINLWRQPVYVPQNPAPMRPGADDHLQFKSRGM
jgi:hypothetical protein